MIRFCFVFLCAFVSLWLNSSAQTFQKLYGDSTVNDIGNSIIQTSDGGYLIAGTQSNFNNQIETLFLIRTNSQGDTLWTRRIKEPSVNYSGSSVIKTYDGGFAVTGIKGDGSNFVPYILKFDSSGNILWNRSYLWFAQEHINSIVQTPDSGFLLSGYLYNGDMLVYFIRTDVNGDTLWTKSYGENDYNAQVYSVRLTPDGGFVAAGFIQDQLSQNVDAFLFKTDSAGNFLWAKSYGDANYNYCQMADVTSDGGLIMAAVTYAGLAAAEYYLIKTDPAGNLEWSKSYGGAGDDRSETVRQMNDGGYLMSGESSSFSLGNFDSYLVRTNSSGDTIWTRTVHGLQNNESYSMIITDDGGCVMVGNYFAHPTNNDLFFLKVDSNGFMGCGDHATNPEVEIPVTNVINHFMNLYPSQPSVVAHTLEIESGTNVISLCETDFIGVENSTEDIFIYPNPVHSNLNIELKENRNSIFQIKVFSITLSEINLPLYFESNKGTVDCSMLIPGIYILEISTGREVIHRKFIKQ